MHMMQFILRLDATQQYVLFCSMKYNICNDDNIDESSMIGYSALVDPDSKNMIVFLLAQRSSCVNE